MPASRVYGIETEFGLAWTLPESTSRGRARLTADEAAHLLFRPVSAEHKATNAFLRNGGRLYLDVGSHPEYATPECADLLDLIAHDRAGELILLRLAQRAQESLAADGPPVRFHLLKNNVDSHGNSYGSHENYLVGRGIDADVYGELLAPFLVSRQLLCGTGHLLADEHRWTYVLSQRAEHLWDAASSSTTRARPLVNTRDEPHADPRRHRRLHILAGDSTLTDATTLLRVGSTELVLRLVEHPDPAARRVLSALQLASPMAAIRAVSRDVTGRTPVRLASGATMTGLELQRAVLAGVQAHVTDLGELLHRVCALWERVLDAIADQAFERIDTLVDWAVKRRLLAELADRHLMAPGDPRLRRLSLAYHELGDAGVCRLLERRGLVPRLVDDDRVTRAVDEPPSTRAALRGRLIAAGQRQARDLTVDWGSVTVNDVLDGTLLLPDPLRASDPRVDSLVQRMSHEPRTEARWE